MEAFCIVASTGGLMNRSKADEGRGGARRCWGSFRRHAEANKRETSEGSTLII